MLLLLSLLCSISPLLSAQTEMLPPTPQKRYATPPARTEGPLAPDHVAGRVVSAADGHPIPNALVNLQAPQGGQVLASTHADTEGRYHFDPQPVGKYSLRASAPGYLGAAYQEHDSFSTAIVLGAGLATDNLTLTLVPSATVAGRVLDEAGDPVQHAQITLYRENPNLAAEAASTSPEDTDVSRITRARNAQTNDDGTFEFAGVAPGRFFLSANATPWYAIHPRSEPEGATVPYRSRIDPALDVAYPETFYPNSIDPSGAEPITIKGGEQVKTTMVMQPQTAVTLTVHLQSGDPNVRGFPQLTRTVFGMTEQVQTQPTGVNGQAFVIAGIAPGRYNLERFTPGSRFGEEEGSVDLTGTSATFDLPAETRTATVLVRVQGANGTEAPAGMELNLRSSHPGQFRRSTLHERLTDKDSATLNNVPPGDYRFSLFHDGRSLTVAALSVNGKPVADRQLHVAGTGEVTADLTVTSYAPTLEGFARQNGKGVPASMVVLVPAGADTAADLFRRDQSDLDGSFTLSNVVPGNYLLVAIDDGWKLPRWNDAAALTPYLTHAVPVTVATSGGSTIHLPDAVTTQPR